MLVGEEQGGLRELVYGSYLKRQEVTNILVLELVVQTDHLELAWSGSTEVAELGGLDYH